MATPRPASTADQPILDVQHLRVTYGGTSEMLVVKGLSFQIRRSETLGVIGASGSGKTQAFLAILGLLPASGRASGRAVFAGQDLLTVSPRTLNAIRGRRIAMVFQDPLSSLAPHLRIGKQLKEVLNLHRQEFGEVATRRCLEILELVRVPNVRATMRAFPHELSGGMRQRVMMAMAVLCQPELLIADEPTSSLDLQNRGAVLDVLRDLQHRFEMSLCVISHDMAVVAGNAQRVLVLADGVAVEEGNTSEVLTRPRSDYTRRLIGAVLDVGARAPGARQDAIENKGSVQAAPLLSIRNLRVDFHLRAAGWRKRSGLRAVDDVSFDVYAGEGLGIVGESGSGKSTLARAILQLQKVTGGSIYWRGTDIRTLPPAHCRALHSELQAVFQDPATSLDPSLTIGRSIAEPLLTHRPTLSAQAVAGEVKEMMARVGLDPAWLVRRPHQLSGGQNQRAAIARAMILDPSLVVLDEPTSSLDVLTQAQVIDLLRSLLVSRNMAIILISHDLAVVSRICHRIAVLYRGRIVEFATWQGLFNDARHPYTRALLTAIPTLDLSDPSRIDRTRQKFTPWTDSVLGSPQARAPLTEVSPGHWVADS